MGCVIYVDGSLSVYGDKREEVEKEISEIKDGWGDKAFALYTHGILEFANSTMEGNSPFTDGVETPLNALFEIAKANDLSVDGVLSVNSSWSDYDDMEINIENNVMTIKNSVLSNASTDELIKELIERKVLPEDFKAPSEAS